MSSSDLPLPKLYLSHSDGSPEGNISAQHITSLHTLDQVLIHTQQIEKYFAIICGAIETRFGPSFQRYHQLIESVYYFLLKMLNTRELTKLLNANVHSTLFPSWLIMTPNASLLAYSGKPNIKQFRAQATLLSQIWKENSDKLRPRASNSVNGSGNAAISQLSSSASSGSSIAEGALETLTIETSTSNIIIRAVQPRLLLVLIGGSPPQRTSQVFRVTPEARGDSRYPPSIAAAGPSKSDLQASSDVQQSQNAISYHQHDSDDETRSQQYMNLNAQEKMRLLEIQREKIDAATEFMRGDFDFKGFIMPEESSIP